MPDIRDAIRWRTITAPNPAAGANFTLTVPGHEVWIPMSFVFRLVTDATVANRVVTLNVSDQTNDYLKLTATESQAASLTRDYTAIKAGSGGTSPGTVKMIVAPSLMLPIEGGHQLSSIVESIQAGDQISRIAGKFLVVPTGPRVRVDLGAEWLLESMREDERIIGPYFAT